MKVRYRRGGGVGVGILHTERPQISERSLVRWELIERRLVTHKTLFPNAGERRSRASHARELGRDEAWKNQAVADYKWVALGLSPAEFEIAFMPLL